MNPLKLAWSNFWYIMSQSDLVPVRLSLSVSSLLWAVWGILIATVDLGNPMMEIDRDVMFSAVPLWAWILLFAAHGIASTTLLLLKVSRRSVLLTTSMIGALLWSYNVDLILVSHIEQGVLPLISSQWTLAAISWWVFIRNCRG